MTTSHDLTIVAGLTYRQVDYWTRAGYLTPIGNPRPGHGYPREYADDQVSLAVQMSRLTKAGIPMPQARDVAWQLLAQGYADLGHLATPHFVLMPVHHADIAGTPHPDVVRPIHREAGAA